MTVSLFLSLLLAASPMVATDSACPSTRSIEAQLQKLLSPTAVPGRALVEDQTDRLVLRLQPEGAEGAERIIAVTGSCEERAMAAAVAIATWWQIGGRRDETVPVVEQDAVVNQTRNQASLSPPDQDAGKHRVLITVAAAGFASIASGDVAPGARIGLDLGWWEHHAVRIGLSATGRHTVGLSSGQVGFRRLSGELGVVWSRGGFHLEGVGLVSRISVEGSDYQRNEQSAGFSLGLSMAGRWGLSYRRATLWFEARGVLWPQSQRLVVSDADGSGRMFRDLPHAELQIGAGLSFRLL